MEDELTRNGRFENFDLEFAKLTETDIAFAVDFPLTTLLRYAREELDVEEKEKLDQLCINNILLRSSAAFVRMLVNKHGISTVEQVRTKYPLNFMKFEH